jgi:hypothetical protein
LDFRVGKQGDRENHGPYSHQPESEVAASSVPRVARLMALAIRFEGMLRDETIQDVPNWPASGG